VTYHPLSELTLPKISVTSLDGADLAVPTLLFLSGPSTYDSSGTDHFSVTAQINGTAGKAYVNQATLFLTSTTSSKTATITLTRTGGFLVSSSFLCLPVETFSVSLSAINNVGVLLTLTTGQLSSSGFYHQFSVTAGCTSPTITSVALNATSDAQCDSSFFCLGTLQGSVAGTSIGGASILLAPTSGSSSAVLRLNGVAVATGSADLGLLFLGTDNNEINAFAISDFIPTTGMYSTVAALAFGLTISSTAYSIGPGPLFATTNVVNGGNDVTAPVCTSVTSTATEFTTVGGVANSTTFNVQCTDTGGLGGIIYTTVLLRGQSTPSMTQTEVTVSNPQEGGIIQPIPAFFTGNVEVIGVVAYDQSGNTAFYGDCGTSTYLGILCPKGAASSVSVSMAIFAMMLLVIASL